MYSLLQNEHVKCFRKLSTFKGHNINDSIETSDWSSNLIHSLTGRIYHPTEDLRNAKFMGTENKQYFYKTLFGLRNLFYCYYLIY